MEIQDEVIKCRACITVITGDNFEAPEVALQLGFAMIYGKPLILVVEKNVKLPDSMVKLATLVQRVDFKNDLEMYQSRLNLQKYLETLNYGGPAGSPRLDA